MASFTLSSVVNEEFKMTGLSLRGDAMRSVVAFLERAPDANASLSRVLDALDARCLSSSIVSREVIDEVVNALDRADGAGAYAGADVAGGAGFVAALDDGDGITIVDAFDVPRFQYDAQRRVFHERTNGPPKTTHADANSKIELYRERFHLLRQRIARHRMFVKPAFDCGAAVDRAFCEITPLTGLLGDSRETKYVMGCLSQLEDERFYLEDLTGSIRVDVSKAATSSGLFTENSVVVAEGEVREDGVFEARALGHPPAESREDTRAATNYADFFGAGRLSPASVRDLERAEAASTSDMFVILSDPWLDREATFARLRAVFEGFDALDAIPAMFVLMGDFCSEPFGPAGSHAFAKYRRGFDRLAALLREFPRLRQEARWVFLPGPGDPGANAATPRPAMPRSLLGALPETLPRATFASNPARVRFKSQDLVFFREDLQARMRRNCVLPPSDLEDDAPGEGGPATPPKEGGGDRAAKEDASFDDAMAFDDERGPAAAAPTDEGEEANGGGGGEAPGSAGDGGGSEWERRPLFRHLAATLVQQAHLAPLPVAQMPVYWEHDHALRLYPAPHAVFLGDRSEQQALAKFEDTELVNPGCFADDGSFAVYRPATREVEFSAAPA